MKSGWFLVIAGTALLWFSTRAKAAPANPGNGATADPDAGANGAAQSASARSPLWPKGG